MSELLTTVQTAIKESGLTHEEIATAAGIQRVRVTEWSNKDSLRMIINLEKLLKTLKPKEYKKLIRVID